MTATPTDRKVSVMSAWAETLARSAHFTLDRMDSALNRTEEKIAQVREKIVRRDREFQRLLRTP
ncbi:hypothetical protein R5W24_006362 [Gemmata sp. JC717]|uniref:hypothetical protein n=1 Tax=Gemmata algarum TaxID=2975278 RepID=UPI0021BB8EB2|nr:hypothetical protein [Gemmata algarum]MDY3557175.1 hypothetical protein [Gemmata algarum]